MKNYIEFNNALYNFYIDNEGGLVVTRELIGESHGDQVTAFKKSGEFHRWSSNGESALSFGWEPVEFSELKKHGWKFKDNCVFDESGAWKYGK